MSDKCKINSIKEIKIDFYNEISIKELISAIDNSDVFSLFEINENNNVENGEKNILINIKKQKNNEVKINVI